MSGLVLDTASAQHIIRWVRDDAIAVDALEMRGSFAVSTTILLRDWAVADLHALDEARWQQLLDTGVDLILLGVGPVQQHLPPALLYRALARGIGVEVMTNAAAARTYNLLVGEGRNVLAAFILPPAAT